jgi:uncharacterized protein YjdB
LATEKRTFFFGGKMATEPHEVFAMLRRMAFLTFLFFFFLLLFLSCSGSNEIYSRGGGGNSPTQTIHVTSIALNKTSLPLGLNAQETLTASIQPENATNKSVSWSTSNSGIATVSSGTVKATGYGEATITAATQDGNKVATCKVVVADIYMAGTNIPSGGSNKVPALWKNSALQTLALTPNLYSGEANSVFVSGGNVYVAGREVIYESGRTTYIPTLWRNGANLHISSGGYYSLNSAHAVFVHENDVYVVGYDGGATLWKNGQAQNLSGTNSNAYGIFVSNNNVYVVGNISYNPVIWVNGISRTLPKISGMTGEARSVYVSGSDVYVVGDDGSDNAILWKNSVPQHLPNPSSLNSYYRDSNSVFVSGGNTYVAGGTRNGAYAVLWTNGVGQRLNSSASGSNSVYVLNNDVYVCGSIGSYAAFWMNGQGYILRNTNSDAKSIFVSKDGGGDSGDEKHPTRVTLNKNTMAIAAGSKETLTATVEPWYVPNRAVRWSSSNSNVATVASDGTVTAHNSGNATITVTTVDANRTARCEITVADIYVAGYRNVSGKAVATLWKNGQAQSLTNGSYSAVAESVYVDGGNTYVVGYELNGSGKSVAKVWRNGSLYQTLTNGENNAAAYSISYSNGNVYVVGHEFNSQGRPMATIWTNGTAKRLADDTYSTYAYSVTASGSNVYVAGEYRNGSRQVAVVWKDSVLQTLGNETTNTVASNVAVANGTVYVSGTEADSSNMQYAVMWTNGSKQRLTSGQSRANAHSISVSGNDVYVGGGEAKWPIPSNATVWKNGVSQELRAGGVAGGTTQSYARSVFALGDNFFAAGLQHNVNDVPHATLWKGTTAEVLAANAEARGVFVR